MVRFEESDPLQLVVTLESMYDSGFDEINYVNTVTGQMTPVCANLMEYNIVLDCFALECDKFRVSTFDPVNKVCLKNMLTSENFGY